MLGDQPQPREPDHSKIFKPSCAHKPSFRSFSFLPILRSPQCLTTGNLTAHCTKIFPSLPSYTLSTKQSLATSSAVSPPPTHPPTSLASVPSHLTSQKSSSPASTSHLKYAAARKPAGIICYVIIIGMGIVGGVPGVTNSSLRLKGKRRGLSQVRG